MLKYLKRNKKILLGLAILLFIGWWFCLPRTLFRTPLSRVLLDREGQLLGARIAKDGQWRFPQGDSVPFKFKTALLEFEDRRFYNHLGLDPVGLLRAVKQNFREGKIVSGGSTLTMQTARLARAEKNRGLKQKLIETLQATRIEFRYSKEEILAMYTAHAPFGGNVVGLEAACWRYYGKSPELLSWGEAATLAVLPNSPGLIHPGRNRTALRAKRNRLLDRLAASEKIDSFTCNLAKEEPIPDKPLPLPDLAPHLLNRAFGNLSNTNAASLTQIRTTINTGLQKRITELVDNHNKNLKGNEIHNLAALVIKVETGETLAYVGNAPNTGAEHQASVDVIKAPRSTGSILKPFLYARAIDAGEILPKSLLKDIPTNIGGYRPENYHQNFDGRVAADRALARSLNIPFVRLLQDYGQEKFYRDLKNMGITSLGKNPSHYGLSLILGGAEGSLWDICSAYASMARTLRHFQVQSGEYRPDDFRPAHYVKAKPKEIPALLKEAPTLSAAAVHHTFRAMEKVERPTASGDWEQFASGQNIAWKTGTSFGFRDAWAVGVTPEYVVGVWAGNADGEGRPGCIGIQAAAPVLFDIFDLLPDSRTTFEVPYDELSPVALCKKSGFRALSSCEADTILTANSSIKAKACPFHKQVHLDAEQAYRVSADCYFTSEMVHKSWFVLPPAEEFYYKKRHSDYRTLPPRAPGCANIQEAVLQFIYPKPNTVISIPRDLNGKQSRTVFKAAHRQEGKSIHWHLNEEYLGSTETFHSLELLPPLGQNNLTLVDEDGARAEITFEVK